MPQWLGELTAGLVLLVSGGTAVAGLVWIHPGLALFAAGVTGVVISLWYLRRDRPVPGLPPEPEYREFPEDDPDDDGRMEVRPL